MGLQVVGAGLGRTGTNSLKVALEELLGGTCYHMFELGQRLEQCDVWVDAFEDRPVDWDALFNGFTAAVDWPAAPHWRTLSDVYPEATILLSVREPDAWWTSVSNTIWPRIDEAFAADAPDDGRTRMFRAMMNAFTPDWRDETAAKAAYLAHNESVRALAPADRLVEWSPGDGWEPICRALHLPVPPEPFPHVNTTEDFQARVAAQAAQAAEASDPEVP